MNKTIATTLLVLASGLTLSTTTLAEPFKHSSSYVNAISNVYSSTTTPSTRNVRHVDTIATVGGFNDRTEYTVTAGRSGAAVESSIPNRLSVIARTFNDRS
ncbi:MAG: hypothetical protein KDI73_06555 [Candidatus Competibacteraceae bacterium]|nr:hypothetical protein [Candidatus Competibacteraceae bacterium]